jgi:hypothetical protein
MRLLSHRRTTRTLLVLAILLGMYAVAVTAVAAVAPAAKFASASERRTYVESLRDRTRIAKEAAVVWATARNLPVRGDDGTRTYELMSIEDGRPLYYITDNANAAISTAADKIRNTIPYDVNGQDLTVGVWDGGAILATHQEFGSRVSVKDGASVHYHATHVGGTIGAAGVVSSARGMAPSVDLDSYDWTSDTAEMASRAASTAGEVDKIYLSNHSYGIISGWYYLSAGNSWSGQAGYHWPNWITWGASAVDDAFGQYDTNARTYDEVAYNAPYYLVFKSAGNDRSNNPSNGETVYYYSGGTWHSLSYSSASAPGGDGVYDGGYDTVSSVGNAKNIMTVGAAYDAVSGGSRRVASGTMSSFSGWGPSDDGRIKPDIVANGVALYSTDDDSDSDYASRSGTSMSTPNACGSAALIVDYYGDLFPGAAMRASTLKALIIHTADDVGNAGPDYAYGWGLMNTLAAAEHLTVHQDNLNRSFLLEDQLSTGSPSDSHAFRSDGSGPIRATIGWTDPPGTASTAYDSRTAVLVNDLDLRITGPGGTYQPYVLNVSNPSQVATTGDNTCDNVEQVFIASPTSGSYSIAVTHKGALSGGVQNYSLILSGQATDVTLEITSQYGNASPGAGMHTNTSGDAVSCSITNSPVEFTDAGSWKTCICTGWIGTGSVDPASGSGTNVTFTITEDSSITWLWQITDLVLSNQTVSAATNYTVRDTISARDGYTVDVSGSVVFEAGDEIRLQDGFTARSGSVFRATVDAP